eukprot:NODE_1802_length_756_cov_114.830269_g1510_i0.p1 GENE.NODE_1802_length_756_cov_114.830269_g1510_i0~~NODE_1802_length_756_cov_114.830269_g1510_i0.p1  ORF type:complete len:141 (-),score=8.18 NODE_1802_length_756_cov_114.830269_g1510_i0:259-681(-)
MEAVDHDPAQLVLALISDIEQLVVRQAEATLRSQGLEVGQPEHDVEQSAVIKSIEVVARTYEQAFLGGIPPLCAQDVEFLKTAFLKAQSNPTSKETDYLRIIALLAKAASNPVVIVNNPARYTRTAGSQRPQTSNLNEGC